MSAALTVTDLTVAYERRGADPSVVVNGVSFALHAGRTLGVAGESGCGKSTAALAAIGFRDAGARVLAGRSLLGDEDLLALPRRTLQRVWGQRVAYVAQDAMGALDPLQRVETQLAEPLRLHLGVTGAAARTRALALLEEVALPDPEAALRRYPHQFSGGQQQRIALAVAMACEPEVLVLDEPTTGLDVTTQRQISLLIERLVLTRGAAAMHISHDLALLATTCDEIAIMYAGEIVERGPAAAVCNDPRHPYARALLDAVPHADEARAIVGIPGMPPPAAVFDRCAYEPRCRFAEDACRREPPPLAELAGGRTVRCVRRGAALDAVSGRLRAPQQPIDGEPLLAVEDLVCAYRGAGGAAVVAVDGVALACGRGETLAVVGESGSGKSTLLRAVAGLHPPQSGRMTFAGAALAPRAARRPREVRRAVQLVFQNPHAALNPRHPVRDTIERPLELFEPSLGRRERERRLFELLDDVRLDPGVADRLPHELSGGQKQRVALARAFAARPDLLLCDEVVSALDVSVQATVLELLATLARRDGTAVLFVTHDLAVVRQIADRVCVMRDGAVCETGATEALYESPGHPYTRELLAAAPRTVDAGAPRTVDAGRREP